MEDYIITIEDPILKQKVQTLLNEKNIVFSLTAPIISSPFPLWVWNTTLKMWICDKWKNVGEYVGDNANDFRVTESLIRIKN